MRFLGRLKTSIILPALVARVLLRECVSVWRGASQMPDDLRPQLDEMAGYLQAAGIASFCRDGVEADDYIACLARRAVDAGMAVVIASSDKDFMQLVSARGSLDRPATAPSGQGEHEQLAGRFANAGLERAATKYALGVMTAAPKLCRPAGIGVSVSHFSVARS